MPVKKFGYGHEGLERARGFIAIIRGRVVLKTP